MIQLNPLNLCLMHSVNLVDGWNHEFTSWGTGSLKTSWLIGSASHYLRPVSAPSHVVQPKFDSPWLTQIQKTTSREEKSTRVFSHVYGWDLYTPKKFTLPETNSKFAPENGWLEDEFPIGKAYFQGQTVCFKGCNEWIPTMMDFGQCIISGFNWCHFGYRFVKFQGEG